MENKSNSGIMIVVAIVLVVVMFVVGWFLGGKFNVSESNKNNDVMNTANEIIDTGKDTVNEAVDAIKNEGLTEEEFYNKVKGTWYYINESGAKYGLSFTIENYNGVDVFFYNVHQCTDGGNSSVVFSFKYLGNNVYQVYSFLKGYSNEMSEQKSGVNRVLIDISDIDNKTIKVRNGDSTSKEVVYKLWENDKNLCE